MKKVLLLALFLIGYVSVYAQDIIKTKDGQTIQSQVVEVGETIVKYKKWDNLNGPTYSMAISRVNTIKYQNGSIDNFEDYKSLEEEIASSIDRQGANIGYNIYRTSESVSNIAKKQDLYKRARTIKTCGWIFGGLTVVGCLAWSFSEGEDDMDYVPIVPAIVTGIGVTATVAVCKAAVNKLEDEAENLACYPLIEYEINDKFALNVINFDYKPANTSCYGMGVSLKF